MQTKHRLNGLVGLSAAGLVLVIKSSAGCSSNEIEGLTCASDTECKGDRICVDGTCVSPETSGGWTSSSSASSSGTAGSGGAGGGNSSSSTGGSSSGGGVGGASSSSGSSSSTGSSSSSGSSSSTGSSSSSSGTGGAGGGMSGGCEGTVVTLDKITNPNAIGAVVKGTQVSVNGVVVMSPKFLVSKSQSGTCLYGVFVSAPGLTQTAAYSGIMVVSKGNNAVIPPGQTTSYCGKLSNRLPGDGVPGDSIPDDVKPGDVLDIAGTADSFLLTQCATEFNGSQVAQRQIASVCKAKKTGTAFVPVPRVFSSAQELAQFASPTDTAFHDQWGGVKVRLQNVFPAAQPDPNGGGGQVVVGSFGIIKLYGSNLEVGDKIYYRGYDPQTCFTAPMFSDLSITWSRIDGFSYMNYCTWSVQPGNKCSSFNPSSEDCIGVTCN